MDQPRASRWRGCVHSSQGQKQALQLNKSSSGQIKLFPCHTAYNSIPSLLKEIYPLRLSKCYTIFSSNMCSMVPRGEENSALFSSFDVYSQKTFFIYYPPIIRLFTSSLPLANLSHFKKNVLATCIAPFIHTTPKRLLLHPGPNVSQTSEPKVTFGKPTLCETNFPEFMYQGDNMLSRGRLGRNK